MVAALRNGFQRASRTPTYGRAWMGVLALAVLLAAAAVLLLAWNSGRTVASLGSSLRTVPDIELDDPAVNTTLVGIGTSPLFGSAFAPVASVRLVSALAPLGATVGPTVRSRAVPATSVARGGLADDGGGGTATDGGTSTGGSGTTPVGDGGGSTGTPVGGGGFTHPVPSPLPIPGSTSPQPATGGAADAAAPTPDATIAPDPVVEPPPTPAPPIAAIGVSTGDDTAAVNVAVPLVGPVSVVVSEPLPEPVDEIQVTVQLPSLGLGLL